MLKRSLNGYLSRVGAVRPEANILKPTELSLGRVYEVQWKKEKPNPEELARLYWVEGLTQIQVAARFRVRRATIPVATNKFENYFKNKNVQVG